MALMQLDALFHWSWAKKIQLSHLTVGGNDHYRFTFVMPWYDWSCTSTCVYVAAQLGQHEMQFFGPEHTGNEGGGGGKKIHH